MGISLVTADGDKVTISRASSVQVGVGSYNYRGQLNDNTVSLQGSTLHASAESSFSLSVEGSLSQDELNDIKKLVSKIEHFGANLLSQPANERFLQTLALGNDLDSIASFEATVSAMQQITVAQEVQQEAVSSADSPPSQPQAVAAPESPSPQELHNLMKFVKKLLHQQHDSKGEGNHSVHA
jgi:hypothetical protein